MGFNPLQGAVPVSMQLEIECRAERSDLAFDLRRSEEPHARFNASSPQLDASARHNKESTAESDANGGGRIERVQCH